MTLTKICKHIYESIMCFIWFHLKLYSILYCHAVTKFLKCQFLKQYNFLMFTLVKEFKNENTMTFFKKLQLKDYERLRSNRLVETVVFERISDSGPISKQQARQPT